MRHGSGGKLLLWLVVALLTLPGVAMRWASADGREDGGQAGGWFSVVRQGGEDAAEPLPARVGETLYIRLYDTEANKTIQLPLEEYVAGVVAAEMPVSFGEEALKAQAVAARTLVWRNVVRGDGCGRGDDADICSASNHCQAWISEEEMISKFGGKDSDGYQRIHEAADSTAGQIMTYGGEPIEVLFYSTSNGWTEDAAAAFSHSLPYYQVVESPGEEQSSRFAAETTFTRADFIKVVETAYPGSGLKASQLEQQIEILSETKGNRVAQVRLGSKVLEGTEFRKLFGLRSADFSFTYDGDHVVVHTVGYGHGVGMSQVGADVMADQGSTYEEILLHYYQGVTLTVID